MEDCIFTNCPTCNNAYRFAPDAVGKKARCKRCETIFEIEAAPTTLDDLVVSWLCEDEEETAVRPKLADTGVFVDTTDKARDSDHPVQAKYVG